MPTELGKSYSPLWRGKYPHMLREDYPVWNRFLERYAGLITLVYYDVRVGGPVANLEDYDEKMRKMYAALTAKRIDALVEFTTEVWLVEVATTPGLRSLGQLATYVALYSQDPKIDKPTYPYLVCDWLDPDLEAGLNQFDIKAILI